MTTYSNSYGLYGHDSFLGRGAPAKERRNIRLDKRRTKNEMRKAEVEQKKVLNKSLASQMAQLENNPDTGGSGSDLVIIGIAVFGVIIIGGLVYGISRRKHTVKQTAGQTAAAAMKKTTVTPPAAPVHAPVN